MNTADLGELQISLPEYNLLDFFLYTKVYPKDALVFAKNLSNIAFASTPVFSLNENSLIGLLQTRHFSLIMEIRFICG